MNIDLVPVPLGLHVAEHMDVYRGIQAEEDAAAEVVVGMAVPVRR